MNNKFLPGAVLFIITFVLSSQAFLTHVNAQTNTFYGEGAGNLITSGAYNSGFGFYTLASDNSGSENSAIGDSALLHNSTGSNNTASGSFALYSNTTGNYNSASGHQALSSNTTYSNTASGTNALHSNTTGNANTASGTNALFSNTTGSTNMGRGANALFSNTTGDNNTASGFYALTSNTTGPYNMANGYESLYNNTTGAFNAANGVFALYNNTIGNFNTAAGPGALLANTTGSNNVALGITAGIALTTGSGNICIGGAHAGSLMFQRRFDEARRELEQLLNIIPDDTMTLVQEAAIFQAQGDLKRAAALLDPLPLANNHVLYAKCYQSLLERSPARMIPQIQDRLSTNSSLDRVDRGEARFWLGWLEEIRGDHAAALENWRQARAELEPNLKEEPEYPFSNL